MKRWQVRSPKQDWSDPGPDLLRPLEDARTEVRRLGAVHKVAKRRHDGTWGRWHTLDADLPVYLSGLADDQVMRVANRRSEILGYARASVFLVSDYFGATPAAETANALMREAFPNTELGGIFTCKHENGDPAAPWSDHAWGDAVDRSYGDTEALFDWTLRMARHGLLPAELILGSRGGVVVNATAPEWTVQEGGASSHLWHVHVSCHRHDGVPPCA